MHSEPDGVASVSGSASATVAAPPGSSLLSYGALTTCPRTSPFGFACVWMLK